MRSIEAVAQTFDYVYDKTGGIKETRFPGIYDGAIPLTVFQNFDDQSRPVKSWWSNGSTAYQEIVDAYAHAYSIAGSVHATETVTYENATVETIQYSDRLQPTRRKVVNGADTRMDLVYSFKRAGDNKNNGNVFSVADNVVANRNQTFVYDGLNRLTSGASATWTHSFTFDRWGNRFTRGVSGTQSLASQTLTYYTSNNNRIWKWNGVAKTDAYDAAGNMIAPPGTLTYQFDADNRVKKVTSAGTWYTFRDLDGNPVYEYKTGAGGGFLTYNHYFQGRLVFTNTALASPTAQWIYTDHLGSPRLRLDAAGNEKKRLWYYPYGEEFLPSADPIKYRYNAKELDPETDLYDYGARYYDPLMGRFTAVDPARDSVVVEIPQTWNRYTYARENPMRYLDPDGKEPIDSTLLRFYNAVFGKDFSWINVQTGALAELVTGAANANGVTAGPVIFLSKSGAGAYRARTRGGITLLGHELTHTIQYGWFPDQFLSSYFGFYLYNRARGQDHATAYRNIPQEAIAFAVGYVIGYFLDQNPDILMKLQAGTPLSEKDIAKVQDFFNTKRAQATDVGGFFKVADSQRDKAPGDPTRAVVYIDGIPQR